MNKSLKITTKTTSYSELAGPITHHTYREDVSLIEKIKIPKRERDLLITNFFKPPSSAEAFKKNLENAFQSGDLDLYPDKASTSLGNIRS